MSTVDTLEEATSVLAAATAAYDRSDWATAGPLLEALRASTVVTDERWTEVRVRLGDVRWHEGSVAVARDLYDQGTVGAGPYAAQAAARLAELDRATAATTAAADGVQADDLDGVLNAAGEALMRGDHRVALEHYERAWTMPNIEAHRQAVIAEGRGQCLVHLARYDEAEEWFAWLRAFGDDMYRPIADAALADIADHVAAMAAVGDGAQVGEWRAVVAEATDCYNRSDYASALQLFEAVLANPTLPTEKRGNMHFNVAQCYVRTGDIELARATYLQGLGLGIGGWLDEQFNDRLDMLDRQDAALATAGLVSVD